MQGVANVSFLAMFLMYLLAALFGYLTFNGKSQQSQLVHNPWNKTSLFQGLLYKAVKSPPGAAATLFVSTVCHGWNIWVNVLKCSQSIALIIQEPARQQIDPRQPRQGKKNVAGCWIVWVRCYEIPVTVVLTWFLQCNNGVYKPEQVWAFHRFARVYAKILRDYFLKNIHIYCTVSLEV